MGHIGGELFVTIDPVVERRDHPTQRATEAPDLIGACRQVGNADAARVHFARVLVTSQFGSRCQISQRVGDCGCQNKAQPHRHQRCDHEHLQDAFPLAPHQTVNFTGCRDHSNRADCLVSLHNRRDNGKERATCGVQFVTNLRSIGKCRAHQWADFFPQGGSIVCDRIRHKI